MSCALLVSTYNWPEALKLFLLSVEKQEVMPDEILIADDGSRPDTKKLIDSFRDRIPSTIHHVWHEDEGFRKTFILNKALAKCTSDYIIQIDGDCILHPKTVSDHLNLAERGMYIYGTRVHLKIAYVPEIIAANKISFSFFHPALGKRPRRLRIPFISSLGKKEDMVSPKLRGCNMSFWKSDIVDINGFNEDIHGWGRSDSELAIRMHNIGIKTIRMKFMGFVYHLDHIESDKSRFQLNDKVQQDAVENKIVWATNGLDKYL